MPQTAYWPLRLFNMNLKYFGYTLLLCFSLCLCDQNGDPWASITSSPIYASQPNCTQTCLRNVQFVTNCISYGCVCTGDPRGTNFVAGFTNISACAEQTCGNDADANDAVNAFRDICLLEQGFISTTSASTASPIATEFINSTVTISVSAAVVIATAPPIATQSMPISYLSLSILTKTAPTYLLIINTTSYASLNPCSKFTINSCRDHSGAVNEPNCGTDKKPSGWDQYRGLAYQLQCSTPSCLCAGGAFNLTYGTLWKMSLNFCNYLPTTTDVDDPEYDHLQGVLADYCELNNFSPEGDEWVLPVIGNSTWSSPGG